jgi:hypothetical protein
MKYGLTALENCLLIRVKTYSSKKLSHNQPLQDTVVREILFDLSFI